MIKTGMNQTVSCATTMLKASLSVFLLTYSLTLRADTEALAEHDAVPATIESATHESVNQKNVVAGTKSKDVHNSSARRVMLPWPDRKRAVRSAATVPPPPPGPYMSTALSDNTVAGPTFQKNAKETKSESSAQIDSLGRFSPDRPWPSNLRPAKRWQPESGYQYHGTQQENASNMHPMNNRPAATGMGYPSSQGQQVYRDRQAGNRPNSNNYSAPGQMSQMPNPRGQYYSSPPGYPPGYRPGRNHHAPSNNPPYSTQGRP